MTDLTKHRSSFNPWIIGYPFLPATRERDGQSGRAPVGPSWLTALRCRLRRDAIDREIAAGVDPHSNECRHMRAAELTASTNRDALAAAYERHLAAAFGSVSLDVARVNWSAVRAAAPRLAHLARRLREDPGVRAQGVARARLLLADRDSSLYGRGDELLLVDEVRSALALL